MGTHVPAIVTVPVSCAPKKAPCPTCGQPGRRKRTLPPRRVRTVAYKTIAYLEITCGEYQVGLVHQRRGLESLPRLLLGHPLLREPPKLPVDERQEITGRLGVALLDRREDPRHVIHG